MDNPDNNPNPLLNVRTSQLCNDLTCRTGCKSNPYIPLNRRAKSSNSMSASDRCQTLKTPLSKQHLRKFPMIKQSSFKDIWRSNKLNFYTQKQNTILNLKCKK